MSASVRHFDPDRAEMTAAHFGYRVLIGARHTAHGVREAYWKDADGYVWVADVHAR